MTTDAITPDVLLSAYAEGFFPMAPDAAATDLDWYNPDPRGILPLDRLHLPRRLQKQLRQHKRRVTLDRDFAGVIKGCAEARPNTWINDDIKNLYTDLFKRGVAHSCEVWNEDRLVGGIYGLSLGGAFFGESMFSAERDASKIALAHILARLCAA
jgi:leucyl/phenylalanyl-tRNA--protein transferase